MQDNRIMALVGLQRQIICPGMREVKPLPLPLPSTCLSGKPRRCLQPANHRPHVGRRSGGVLSGCRGRHLDLTVHSSPPVVTPLPPLWGVASQAKSCEGACLTVMSLNTRQTSIFTETHHGGKRHPDAN